MKYKLEFKTIPDTMDFIHNREADNNYLNTKYENVTKVVWNINSNVRLVFEEEYIKANDVLSLKFYLDVLNVIRDGKLFLNQNNSCEYISNTLEIELDVVEINQDSLSDFGGFLAYLENDIVNTAYVKRQLELNLTKKEIVKFNIKCYWEIAPIVVAINNYLDTGSKLVTRIRSTEKLIKEDYLEEYVNGSEEFKRDSKLVKQKYNEWVLRA